MLPKLQAVLRYFLYGLLLYSFTLSAQADLTDWDLMDKKREQYLKIGNYKQALVTARQGLKIALKKQRSKIVFSLIYLGEIQSLLGNYSVSASYYHMALKGWNKFYDRKAPEKGVIISSMAALAFEQELYTKAERYQKKAISMMKPIFKNSPERHAAHLCLLAKIYTNEGKLNASSALYHQALSQWKNLNILTEQYSNCLNGLAIYHNLLGDYNKAEQIYKKLLHFERQHYQTNNVSFITTYTNLAVLYLDMGRYYEAEQLLNNALSLHNRLNINHYWSISNTYNVLGKLYLKKQNYTKANYFFQKSLSLQEQILGKNSPQLALTIGNIGLLAMKLGYYNQAESHFKRALALDTKILSDHLYVAQDYYSLAMLYHLLGKLKESKAMYQKSINIFEHTYGKEFNYLDKVLSAYADLLAETGYSVQAKQLYQRALTINKKTYPAGNMDTASILNSMGSLASNNKKYTEAVDLYLHALQLLGKRKQTADLTRASIYNNLAFVYDKQNKDEQAEFYFKQAIQIYKQLFPQGHPDLATFYNNLARFYQTRGKAEKATVYFNRALVIATHFLGNNHPTVRIIKRNMAGKHFFRTIG